MFYTALLVIIWVLNISATSYPFIGHTYLVKFGETVYKNEFLSDVDFRFTCLAGDEKGRVETVKYRTTPVYGSIYKIEWTESDNTTVVHVDDFENMKAYVSITSPSLEFQNWEGTLTQMTDDTSTASFSHQKLFKGLRPSSSYPFVGNTYKVVFDQGDSYMNEFLTSNELRYTGITGDDEGKTETINYVAVLIDEGIYKIYWQEADKTTVVHIDDFIRGKAYASITTSELVLKTWTGTLEQQSNIISYW